MDNALHRAIARAIAAYHRGLIDVIAVSRDETGIHARVSSLSQPGVIHDLTYNDVGTLVCSCPAGEHELVCWHIGLLVFLGFPLQLPLPESDAPAPAPEPVGGTSAVEEALALFAALEARDGAL